MEELVIDTSVIIKWYAVPQEAGHPIAKGLLSGHVEGRRRLHIPMLALYEAGNVLRQLRARVTGGERSFEHVANLFSLGLSTHPLTLARAMLASELAHLFDLSFYDACFVALAQELNIPLVTADERLCRQAAALPFIRPLTSSRAL